MSELIKEAEAAILTQELDYSICLDGGKVVNGQRLVERLLAALKEREWKPISEAKENTKVLVRFKNELGKSRTALAVYFPKFFMEYNGDAEDWADIDENDNYFCPEGWYEDIQSPCSEFGYFKLDYEPTHFQYLTPPEGE